MFSLNNISTSELYKRPMKRIIAQTATILLFAMLASFSMPVTAEQEAPPEESAPPNLKSAVMCEGLKDGLPVDQTIIFGVSKSSAYCWSDFDPVTADGVIYHLWYRNGELISSLKLAVHPPRWAVYSSLRLRQADVGPWRVDITSESGVVLKTLRFSITE